MTCADGTGAFLGMTVSTDAFCRETGDGDNKIAETQALLRGHSEAITASSVLKVRSFAEWSSEVASFDSPNVDLGCGSLMKKRKGCQRTNPPWTAVVEYDGSYELEALIGAEGIIRRWNSDGSYREAYGWIAGATVIPAQASGEETLGSITVQWEGGAANDRGFVKMVDKDGTQKFPI